MPNISFKKLRPKEFFALFKKHYDSVFDDDVTFENRNLILTLKERKKMDTLAKKMGSPNEIFLGAFKGKEFIGWSWGFQTSKETFYMCNSGVLKSYRHMGIYTKMLQMIIEEASHLGFQIIESRHNLTNNSVIIPKLKAGFVISAMELSEWMGTMVVLKYYTNKKRLQLVDFRAGQRRLPKDLSPGIKLLLD